VTADIQAPTRWRVPFADLAAQTAEIRPELDFGWNQVVDSGRFVGGSVVECFEQEWSAYCGVKWTVSVANGTDSLQLILRALDIGRGDEVILPANTFIATAEAVALVGATPRFVDVDPRSLLIDPDQVAAALTTRTAAVIAVHLYGQMADMQALSAVTQRAGVALIEDGAQAHGAYCGSGRAGSVGIAGGFSFYPGKNLGAFGDGGAITTSDETLAARLRSIRDHGRSERDKYVHDRLGTNSRLDALQAAVLSAKLTRLDAWTDARRSVAHEYRELLPGHLVQLLDEGPSTPSVYHLAVVRTKQRDAAVSGLARAGVETGVHYPIPCHLQGPFRGRAQAPLPVAELAAREVLSLPMFPNMTSRQVAYVCETLSAILTPM
jgi:dTDP-4-amino-4,6-dideoxygalactose transaminase